MPDMFESIVTGPNIALAITLIKLKGTFHKS